MEADWAVEIGAGLPVIEADWAGWVNLRAEPERMSEVEEAAAEPALREALVALNNAESPLLSVKCDLWALRAEEIDPLEFDCSAEDAGTGLASWIDGIARADELFASFAEHEAWVRRATERLRAERAPHGRVDWVVRAATANGLDGFGLTVYAAGCGVDTQAAHAAWERILRLAVAATMREARASSSIG